MPEYPKAEQLERAATEKHYCYNSGERVWKGKCPCRSCVGRRSRRKGKRGERDFRKRRGIQTNIAQAAVGEEAWGDVIRWEQKTGGRAANPVGTRFLALEAQAETNRAIGDVRPFGAVWKPDGMGDEIVAFRASQLGEIVRLLAGGE